MAMQRKRRRRSGGNNNNNNNNNNPNRHFESNGPDVRIRGSAQQILDKYMQYARDAQTSGDRVKAEALFQHAEHYARIVAVFEKQKEAERIEREARDAKRAEERAARDAERDAERAERGETTDSDAGSAPEAEPAHGNADASADTDATDGSTRRRAPRRRRSEPQETEAAVSESAPQDTPEPAAADTSEPPEKPKRRRAPRKPAATEEDGIMKTLSRGADAEAVASAEGDS